MSEKPKPGVKFITPRGVAIYPKLQKPDTKFKKEGQYTCKQRYENLDGSLVAGKLVSHDEIVALITAERDAKLAEVIAGIKAKTIGPKWNPKERAAKLAALKTPDVLQAELDKEGEETGNILINAKMTASGVSKKDGKPWKREPKVFDAKRKKLFPIPAIFGGSEMKMSIEAKAYFAPGTTEAPPVVGITYYLEAVQVLKLVKGGDRDAESYGFGEEEGGYENDEADDGSQFAEAGAADSDASGDAPASGSDF